MMSTSKLSTKINLFVNVFCLVIIILFILLSVFVLSSRDPLLLIVRDIQDPLLLIVRGRVTQCVLYQLLSSSGDIRLANVVILRLVKRNSWQIANVLLNNKIRSQGVHNITIRIKLLLLLTKIIDLISFQIQYISTILVC